MIFIEPKTFQITINSLPVIAANGLVDHVITHNLGTDKIQVMTNSNITSTGQGLEIYTDYQNDGLIPANANRGLSILAPTASQVTLRFFRYHGSVANIRVVIKTTD